MIVKLNPKWFWLSVARQNMISRKMGGYGRFNSPYRKFGDVGEYIFNEYLKMELMAGKIKSFVWNRPVGKGDKGDFIVDGIPWEVKTYFEYYDEYFIDEVAYNKARADTHFVIIVVDVEQMIADIVGWIDIFDITYYRECSPRIFSRRYRWDYPCIAVQEDYLEEL